MCNLGGGCFGTANPQIGLVSCWLVLTLVKLARKSVWVLLVSLNEIGKFRYQDARFIPLNPNRRQDIPKNILRSLGRAPGNSISRFIKGPIVVSG